jgi:hypothetical protein
MHKEPALTASKAVVFGHATVTLPVVVIMSGVGVGTYVLTGRLSPPGNPQLDWLWQVGRIAVCVIAAEVPAWMWWSLSIHQWRNWTQRRGIASESLEKLAVRTLLVWRNRQFEYSASRGTNCSLPSVIPPLSLVRVVKVTAEEPDWTGYEGRVFRIGYYRKNDGLDCVWLVDDEGEYSETVDQEMIRTHFAVLQLSDESDLFGADRPVIGPRQSDADD